MERIRETLVNCGVSRIWVLGAAVVLSGVPAAAGAWTPYRSESGAWLRWAETELLLKVTAPPAPTSEADGLDAVEYAASEWTRAGCGGPTVEVVSNGDGVLGEADHVVRWVNERSAWAEIGSSTELARTVLSYRVQSGTLVDADIFVNLAGFEFSTGESCEVGKYDLRYTLTHELGHVFGLDHSDVDGATMAAKAEEGDCGGRTLNEDDLEGYCALYPLEEVPDEGPSESSPEVVEAEDEEGSTTHSEPVSGERRDRGCGVATSGWVEVLLLALTRSGRRAMRRGRRAPAPSRVRS
jgi:hypothetical protein